MKFICPLIVVKNIQRSRIFYENILGQKVKYDFDENVVFEGDFAIHLESHYKKLLNNNAHNITKQSNSFELYFDTDNLEDTYLRLKNEGIEFLHEIVEQPWGQRAIRFYDLDKHIIEVGETMESVVVRLYNDGFSVDEICKRSSMPLQFVESTINTGKFR